MPDDIRTSALNYHQYPKPGKLEIKATKQMANQRDLGLAYSPGVAAACEERAKDPNSAANYTVRSNLVAVVTNGTAVLGLGAIGALASKPVMEGKAVLFKQFADIDVFDIEVDELDPQAFIRTGCYDCATGSCGCTVVRHDRALQCPFETHRRYHRHQ